MTMYYPEGTPTLGNTAVKAVLSITAPAAPKLATEISAATTVDLSCALYGDAWMPTGTTAKTTKKRRLCSTTDVQQIGVTTFDLAELRYAHNPQQADAHADNKARLTLVEGLKIHLLERQGLDAIDTAWAVGQFTRDHYVVLGPQVRSMDTDDNGEYFITQSVSYVNGTGPVNGIIAT